jgi:hypothetical protein
MDARDRRPLEYPLRLCFPMPSSADTKMPTNVWSKCRLAVSNRTTPRAKMLASKEMTVLEIVDDGDVDSEALPQTINPDPEVNPSERYSQIGQNAAGILLDCTIGSVS